MPEASLLLGIDTCGPSGSVALARLQAGRLDLLGQTELAGRTYSATLVSAVAALLAQHGATLRDVAVLVAVSGPGSFTGVRVCLSAAKGLAQPAGLPVVAVSRLAVLARKAGAVTAALDAHRHEVFLRITQSGMEPRELLAGSADLAAIDPPAEIAVCDEASELLRTVWPGTIQLSTPPPTAADALEFAQLRIAAGAFDEIESLDGHYLRRSDAEIFGNASSGSSLEPGQP
ncbi:MAG: tRNA (adenosine(37)-N6)-threonylcarbamoyltransferase complex dimerization subunit type 1 TsaB [Terracidiphilus sp.]